MIIQHNIAALNSYSKLTSNNNAISKNLEKLSSGYKINRAGDDAAGLAISEKMRAQITGLETAQDNANDGISLVQTAEGALTEVHDMLNRMVELATQSSNGTYDNETDRANLQKEVSSLIDEIDRIADSTNFNGINLLNGDLAADGAAAAAAASLDAKAAGSPASFEIDLSGVTSSGNAASDEYTLTIKADGGDVTVVGTDTAGTATTGTDIAALFDSKTVEIDGVTFDISASSGKLTFTAQTNGPVTGLTANTTQVTIDKSGSGNQTVSGNTGITVGTFTDGVADTSDPGDGDDTAATGGLTLQIGDTADTFNQITVNIDAMDSASLGIADIDISTADGAADAIQKIKDAINTVSSTRGDLGAVQNRLEHTINNLTATTENITAAESRIRDTDMAEEMMAYTKNNILVQASQAMLAQANTLPQGVLQLLQ